MAAASDPYERLSDDERHQVKQDIAPVLAAVAERIHYAEGRRTNFTVIAGVLLAGGIALLTFALGKTDSLTTKYSVAAAAISSIVLAAILLVVYSLQTNRYPWTSATKTWKWFYRDALPNQAAFDFPWTGYLSFKNDKERIRAQYDAQLGPFKNALSRLADKTVDLEQDLEQLYVLHVNEKYKNIHLTHLRQITERGVTATALIVIAAFCAGVHMDNQRNQARELTFRTKSIDMYGTWRRSACADSSDCDQVLLTISITNTAADFEPLPSMAGIDSAGLRVPLRIDAIYPEDRHVPPKTTVAYSIALAPVGLVRPPLRAIEVLEQ